MCPVVTGRGHTRLIVTADYSSEVLYERNRKLKYIEKAAVVAGWLLHGN